MSVRDEPYTVRIGIHTGEIIRTGTDLLGLTVNKAARGASAAGPDEIVVSSTTLSLMGSVAGVTAGENPSGDAQRPVRRPQVTSLGWS